MLDLPSVVYAKCISDANRYCFSAGANHCMGPCLKLCVSCVPREGLQGYGTVVLQCTLRCPCIAVFGSCLVLLGLLGLDTVVCIEVYLHRHSKWFDLV